MPISKKQAEVLYAELCQFRVSSDYRGNALENEFWEVQETDLVDTEKRMGIAIPRELREFYRVVGHGHLVKSRDGTLQTDYLNIFVDLQRLSKLWLRDEVSFQYDAKLVAEDELPFFDMGSYNYFVSRPHAANPNAVYAPYDNSPICESLTEFVQQLYQDSTFYLAHEGAYDL